MSEDGPTEVEPGESTESMGFTNPPEHAVYTRHKLSVSAPITVLFAFSHSERDEIAHESLWILDLRYQ